MQGEHDANGTEMAKGVGDLKKALQGASSACKGGPNFGDDEGGIGGDPPDLPDGGSGRALPTTSPERPPTPSRLEGVTHYGGLVSIRCKSLAHATNAAGQVPTARGRCAGCPLKAQCTRSKISRTIKRHDRQRTIDRARTHAHSPAARRDRQWRMHLMELSFADASANHGLKRSRWRRLWRQRIQDHLIAACKTCESWPATAPGAGARPAVCGHVEGHRLGRSFSLTVPTAQGVDTPGIACRAGNVASDRDNSCPRCKMRFGQHAARS